MRIVSIALLVPIAASCASKSYPESPVPAVLTDRQAAVLATTHLDEQHVPPRMVTSIEPTKRGYIIGYKTIFNPHAANPPAESHLVVVHNDGTVRQVTFEEGR